MMDYHDNTFDLGTPLCSFGPGGEFTAHWGELLKDFRPQTKLGRVLAVMAEIVTATAASGRSAEEERTESEQAAVPNILIVKTRTNKGAQTKTTHTPDAKAAGTAQIGRPEPVQLMLFGLDAGVGNGSGDKQDNGVRTYSRAAKKKPAFGRPRQGTLFEADTSRAISA